ncbi:MAG TPA: CRTAC1 family protein, partial [Vicinamibacterales bacterium]|nr:CRTAC1 family protein [Vicinamibacterales bacterium]
GRFTDVSAHSGSGATTPRSSRGAAFGDYDNDGDVDVLVMNMSEPPSLLRNDYAGEHRWLQIRLEGRASNRTAIGATVVVTVDGRRQARAVTSQSSYYSHDDLRLHFGLGRAERAERIEVRWPSGATQVLTNVTGRQVLTIVEERISR